MLETALPLVLSSLALAAVATVAAVAETPAPGSVPEIHGIDATHSEVSFQVRHLVTRVRGRFTEFEGRIRLDPEALERSSVRFTVEAASIDTDLRERDEHLRSEDFFDVARHPRITFVSHRIERAGEDRFEVTGTLTLRGVAREITLPVTYLGAVDDPWGNHKAGFATAITIDRKEYGMVWNAALDTGGLILGDEVAIAINLETQRLDGEEAGGR